MPWKELPFGWLDLRDRPKNLRDRPKNPKRMSGEEFDRLVMTGLTAREMIQLGYPRRFAFDVVRERRASLRVAAADAASRREWRESLREIDLYNRVRRFRGGSI